MNASAVDCAVKVIIYSELLIFVKFVEFELF